MDIVLTTMELLELIMQHRQEFEAILVDESAKVGWQFEEVLKAAPWQQGTLTADQILSQLRVFGVDSHPLYTNSTTSATSNNYLNQVLIRLFKDRAARGGREVHHRDPPEEQERLRGSACLTRKSSTPTRARA